LNPSVDFFPPTLMASRWYAGHLASMREPPLYPPVVGRTVYRFLWLRSFHDPIAVRVSHEAQRSIIVVKKTNGNAVYRRFGLLIEEERELTEEQWNRIERIVIRVSFWESTATGGSGLDGAHWVLEGVNDGKYHVVDEWSPPDGGVREIGLALLELSGLHESPVY
jgi:hypothetical protein